MTLHIRTFTPQHVITVSDRLIDTPSGTIELSDDRYKHLVLMCFDGKIIISFTGFAGIIMPGEPNLRNATIDWLTESCQRNFGGQHRTEDHINYIREQIQGHIDRVRREYPSLVQDVFKLAIQFSGWIRGVQFDCVVDNYLDRECRSRDIRPDFRTLHRIYSDEDYPDGSRILFIGREYLGDQLINFSEQLTEVAQRENPQEIFDASVSIIRSIAPASNGKVGFNCSGVRISRNDPGIQAYGNRDRSVWDTVMPNGISCVSGGSVRNMRGRNN